MNKFFMIKGMIFFIVFFLATLILPAQNLLRLPDAVNIALKNSLDVQLAKNKVEENHINNDYGIAGGLPLVTGALSDNEQVSAINQKLNTGTIIDKSGASTNTLNVGVTGSILLYNGGRVVATKKRLVELELQSKELLNSQVQNILASVMNSYYEIVRQQSYSKTIDRSIDIARKKLEIVETSQKIGMANNADLFQAQIDLNELLQAQQAQWLIINQAKTELLRLLTLKTDSIINVEDTIIVDRSVNLNDVLSGMLKNADVIAADELIKINMLVVKETTAQRYPTIKATTGYNFVRSQAAAGQLLLNQNYGPSVGVSVGIPIYNGSVYKRQQQTAQLFVHDAELQKQILLRDYNAQAVNLFQSYTETLKQLETEQKTYQLSGQLLDLALKRFQYRQATIVEVKNAQQSFEASGYRLVNLNYATKSAEIGLKRLANQLSL